MAQTTLARAVFASGDVTDLDTLLQEAEVRVLGSLAEKQVTTPDYYPLTLNALVHACNQISNRDPVVQYDERQVSETVEVKG